MNKKVKIIISKLILNLPACVEKSPKIDQIKDKVKEACQLVLDGRMLIDALKVTGLTKQTFYKHTGGSRLLIKSHEKYQSFNS